MASNRRERINKAPDNNLKAPDNNLKAPENNSEALNNNSESTLQVLRCSSCRLVSDGGVAGGVPPSSRILQSIQNKRFGGKVFILLLHCKQPGMSGLANPYTVKYSIQRLYWQSIAFIWVRRCFAINGSFGSCRLLVDLDLGLRPRLIVGRSWALVCRRWGAIFCNPLYFLF